MFMCNFVRTLETDLKPTYTCHISGDVCSGSNCLFQRILAALPLTASPIVAQGIDAIETGPGEALPDRVDIKITPTVTQDPKDPTSMGYVSLADVAKQLGITGPGVMYRGGKLGVGSYWGGKLFYSAEEVAQLKAWKKGTHKFSKVSKEPKPGKEKHQVNKEIEAEVETLQTCRVCGCTDADCSQCLEKTGEPCHWVEEDLCSACATETDPDHDSILEADVLREYRTHSHIKILPELIAKRLDADVKRVKRICEKLNEERQLCFAGLGGYYSKNPLPREEL